MDTEELNSELNAEFKNFWNLQRKLEKSKSENITKFNRDDFLKSVSMRNFKSRATDIKNRLRLKNEWEKVTEKGGVNSRKGCGDSWSNEFKFISIKTSLVSNLKGSTVTFRGIKEWEDIKHFVFVVLCISGEIDQWEIKPYIFLLDRNQLEDEVLHIYDLKKGEAKLNEFVKKGISFTLKTLDQKDDSVIFKRWKKEYLTKDIIL